ncbi:spore coat protein [Irregularibacter muris]|uniref:Spore coat protein n=1 Tax=Irregularibacter muris TaxID=1796619 RepID=A0AAE3HGC7_9FIRM|nr:spore coat protein [Irregularibacter muris]MCR1898534.1 spore coat protein [Irregularibacter muris]
MVNLTQKERMLLEDQKSHEELCIKKYNDYANKAQDPQLKQLCTSLGQHEQQHLDTINSILSGQVPNMNQQQQGQQNQQQNQQNMQNMQNQSASGSGMPNASDAYLCNDLLATEKYVSGTYDTTIFECTQKDIRNVLNHIQKEEQEHGESIFNYMQSHGMYNPQ